MHLLFINRFFYPDASATAQLLTDLTTGLEAQGDQVTVVTGRVSYGGDGRSPAQDSYKDVSIVRVWSTNFGRRSGRFRLFDYFSFYLAAAWAALWLKKVDIIVVLSDPPMLSVLAAAFKRPKGWKTVCWLQDVFPEIAVRAGFLGDGLVARALTRVARWSLRQMDRVVVVGRCMERHLLHGGIPGKRIALIQNWADGDGLMPVAPEDNWFRKDHDLEGKVVVMYSGNLGVVHETDSLLHLIGSLRNVSDVCVLFIGEGPGKDRLEAWAHREGMTHIRFAGYQSQEHLRYSLSAGDLHLVTLRTDMAGLSVPSKVYGVMAVGRPVLFIGPAESEVAALVREADCGEVFAPADNELAARTILDLARDRARRERLGASGRKYFEAHLEKRLALKRFGAVFQEVMK